MRGYSHVVSHRDEQDLGRRKSLFVCWLEMRGCLQIHRKGKGGFSVCMVLGFFICIFFSYDVGQLVSVTYLWWCMALKYSLFYVVNLDSFSCICCETLFHTGQCIQRQFFKKFISTIYWMAYLIFFLKHPETCVFRPLCWERNLCILWGWNVFLTMKHEPG